jgi:hypothetical protein
MPLRSVCRRAPIVPPHRTTRRMLQRSAVTACIESSLFAFEVSQRACVRYETAPMKPSATFARSGSDSMVRLVTSSWFGSQIPMLDPTKTCRRMRKREAARNIQRCDGAKRCPDPFYLICVKSEATFSFLMIKVCAAWLMTIDLDRERDSQSGAPRRFLSTIGGSIFKVHRERHCYSQQLVRSDWLADVRGVATYRGRDPL